MWKKTTAML